MRPIRFRPIRPTLKRPRLEALEDRVVPTVHLFVDFGDSFGAGLTITDAQLTGSFASGGIQGPVGLGVAKMTYTSLGGQVVGVIDYNHDGALDTADYDDLKADVLSIIQRVYEPFNVIVEEVANDSVASIQAEMKANNSDPLSSGTRDGYVIVGKAVDGSGVSVGGTSLLGIAGVDSNFFFGNTAPQVNDLDNTTLVFADTVLGFCSTTNEMASLLAFTVCHEAGHSFTLFHQSADDLFGLLPPDTGTLIAGNVMIGNYTGVQQDQLPMIGRFPHIAGDFNFDPTLIENAYANLANFARSNIGAKSDPALSGPDLPNPDPVGPSYVTGTGANDIIRVTRTGTDTALVSVQPFRNSQLSRLIPIPASKSTAYTYSISTAGGILIDAGLGDDQIELSGDFGSEVTVRGMGGSDRLTIDGKGTADVIYTPDGSDLTGFDSEPDRRGTIEVGSTTIHFQEFELTGRITISNVKSFTFQSPGGADNLELINSGAAIRVKGKVGGLDFVPVTAFDADTVVLDTGTNDDPLADNNDVVILKNILVAPGLASLVIDAGPGDDDFQIFQGRLDLPGSGGGISFLGGDGDDRVDVFAGEFLLGGDETFTFDGGDGNDTLDFGQAVVDLARGAAIDVSGGAGDDAILMGPVTAYNFQFDGGEGDDTLSIAGVLNVPGGGDFQFDAGEGDDTLALGAGLNVHKTATFLFDGGDGLDAIGTAGTARHTWAIGNGVITLDNRIQFTTLESVKGGPGTDEFILTPNSFLLGTIDGGGGADVLNLAALGNVRVTLAPSPTTTGFDVTATFLGGKQISAASIDNVTAGKGLGDALVGLDTPALWLLGARDSRYITGKYSMSFSGVDSLIGGTADDTLLVDTTSKVTGTVGKPLGAPPTVTLANILSPRQLFDGGAGGNDSVRVAGSAAAEVFGFGQNVITFGGRPLTFVNTESMTVSGGGGNDVFQLLAVSYGLLRLDVYGDGGADTFNVAPPLTTALRVFGDGANGVPTGSDVLRVVQQGTALLGPRPTNGSGRLFFGGRQPIDYFGFERAEAGSSAAGVGKPGGQFRPFF